MFDILIKKSRFIFLVFLIFGSSILHASPELYVGIYYRPSEWISYLMTLKEIRPDGILLLGQLPSIEETADLLNEIESELGYSPVFAIDQEGGRVQRLKKDVGSLPSAQDLSQLPNIYDIYRHGYKSGEQLKQAGFDLNFAPVVDVWSNPNNTVIGDRSFGATAQEVVNYAGLYLMGLQDAGIDACLKHFPGHGSTTHDSHTDMAVFEGGPDDFFNRDLVPFIKLAPLVSYIMTGHVIYPFIDDEIATYSSLILREMLRKDMKFKGKIITDDLQMKAASLDGIRFERALDAGADIILITGSPRTLKRQSLPSN